jgi:hypothetical protein
MDDPRQDLDRLLGTFFSTFAGILSLGKVCPHLRQASDFGLVADQRSGSAVSSASQAGHLANLNPAWFGTRAASALMSSASNALASGSSQNRACQPTGGRNPGERVGVEGRRAARRDQDEQSDGERSVEAHGWGPSRPWGAIGSIESIPFKSRDRAADSG